ncbi:MAG: hypothetical protein KGZ51_01380 [Erysipelothrix sp.]|jgi:hypothetical protein|nr:hypothetical protein [Erysipelothrix sp.]
MKQFITTIKPLIVLILSYVLYQVSDWLFNGQPYTMLVAIITLAMFFSLGLVLHTNKRKNQDWIKKVLISLMLIVIAFDRLGIVQIQVLSLSRLINDYPSIINGFVVYLGWLFFE